jgi:hypothetical protein
MDAVEDFYRTLPPQTLEDLKASLISRLIENKVFSNYRMSNGKYVIAVDATGVYSSTDKHWEENVHITSKNGTVTYMNNVLEAKLVIADWGAISLCSE